MWIKHVLSSSSRAGEVDEAEFLISLRMDLLWILSDQVGQPVLYKYFLFFRVGCEASRQLEQTWTSFEINHEYNRDWVVL